MALRGLFNKEQPIPLPPPVKEELFSLSWTTTDNAYCCGITELGEIQVPTARRDIYGSGGFELTAARFKELFNEEARIQGTTVLHATTLNSVRERWAKANHLLEKTGWQRIEEFTSKGTGNKVIVWSFRREDR
jgi:hypothetical protein